MTHHNLTDKEIKENEVAAKVEQPNSGVPELPAFQDTSTIPADEEKLKTKKGEKKGGNGKGKGGKKGGEKGSGYTGLNKYRTEMNCSSCGKSMVLTGAITTEEIAVSKKLPPRADGKPPFKPLPSVGANRALAVICDDCIRQSKPVEEGGTNMPITYKTVVIMTHDGNIANIPISSIK